MNQPIQCGQDVQLLNVKLFCGSRKKPKKLTERKVREKGKVNEDKQTNKMDWKIHGRKREWKENEMLSNK